MTNLQLGRPSENIPEGISEAADKAHTATVRDNRIKAYDGAEYYYDTFGNLTFMSLPDGSSRTLSYDLKDRLVLAEIWREGGKEIWRYEYDALDRRIAKEQVEVGEEHRPAADEKGRLKTVPGSRIEFVWDGSRLLQEIHPHGSYTYVYTDQDSYEPLAQICEWEDEAGETRRQVNYFHCDQIGLPREMTDGEGRLLWFGNYGGWGKLTEETNIANAHQPFRLQNQYCDGETGLHYNFFRYYDPHSGRFINQDPIGLEGGENLYAFAPNAQGWVDPLGLAEVEHAPDFDSARRAAFKKAGMTNPSEVQFSKYDPKTGTVVEFKGRGGAKVAYDAPHADMDVSAGHDKPHVGWQTEGKRKSNGARRGNITYRGEQHPHRSDNKDEHDGIRRC